MELGVLVSQMPIKSYNSNKKVKWHELLPWITVLILIGYYCINHAQTESGLSVENIIFGLLPVELFFIGLFTLFTLFLVIYSSVVFGENHWLGVRKILEKFYLIPSKSLQGKYHEKKSASSMAKLITSTIKISFIYLVGSFPFVFLARQTFPPILSDKLVFLPLAIMCLIFCYRIMKAFNYEPAAEEIRSTLISFLYLGLITAVVLGYSRPQTSINLIPSHVALIFTIIDLLLIESGFLVNLKNRLNPKGSK
ncbi:MAG: hypothetical protein IPJ89_02720 [Candidatus Iainarchaeum archaeon]|uniref:Uncharacterized protein n=1 Tax=Candidatus Iainarchaeum sp. TaxID=3101447 RepID=A0A7T9I288_9ARCH|nr:MAG: hypothetical protein IPJ89_02720 [Candidatus Diapherotrites archaeon]